MDFSEARILVAKMSIAESSVSVVASVKAYKVQLASARTGRLMISGTKPKAKSKAMHLATKNRSRCRSKPKRPRSDRLPQTMVEARGTLAVSSPSSFIT